MKCPFCDYDESKVVDSRPVEEGTMIRRRRECIRCAKRFTTYERIENIPLIVVKKGGQRVPFDKNKILNGMIKACEKRPVPIDNIQRVVDLMEKELYQVEDKEVESSYIGERVMDALKDIDQVAYVSLHW
ncbi:ATP-cone domain protein [Eubacterium callanderi]|uniref:Transcriptional repressor NrdR n=1 Tax=Eubacterium callanderi TaxID=53442 RepID=E3GE07_9FIRM|nr:transcriptional regulator NrdR [Eubacterium callanderi]ADO37502.1 ATP-cone domain protein [Eubacterium callanderi]